MIIYGAFYNSELVYVGQTIQSFAHRRGSHWSHARAGSKLYLHRIMKKYPHDITFEVLEKAGSQEELCFLEKYYIKNYAPKCNSQLGGKSNFVPWNKGKKENRKEVLSNISKSAKGRTSSTRGQYSEAHKEKIAATQRIRYARPFICVNNNKIYSNKTECAKDLGIPAGGISLVLMQSTRNKSYKGYIFNYI